MKVGGIDVLVEGEGREPILFIHGWPDTYRLWDRQVEALRAGYRCIRFTLPGFDPVHPRRVYPLDELIELIRRIVEQAAAGQKVTLLLHDWGCFFGYQFALRHPQLVARVIGVDVGDAGSRRHLQELSVAAKAMIAAYQLWLALAWRVGGRPGDWMTRAMARAAGARGDLAQIGARMTYPYYAQWIGREYRRTQRFTPFCPMLFIYGTRKPFMFHSQAWATEVAGLPRCRVLAFDAGHWLMRTRSAQFNEAVRAWLDEQTGT